MININDPLVKRLIENLHKSIERKSKNLSANANDDYVTDNRIIKILCEDKMRGPRECAAEMNARYGTDLDNEDVIRLFKANRLSHQAKRAELLNWATDTIETFARALDTHSQKYFDEFIALRKKNIQTRDGERYKIQERIIAIMLYVRHPELDSGNDSETIEKFGNVYMKHFIYDASDFLRNICIRPTNSDKPNKNYSNLTIKDFLILLYSEYPEIADGIDEDLLEKFGDIYLKNFLNEAINSLEDFDSGMTIEEFFKEDPDAQSTLISPSTERDKF